jgi:hypothetical protein
VESTSQPKVPPLTAYLYEHGSPQDLEPYTQPCKPPCPCKAKRHLTTRAARQLYDDYARGDEAQRVKDRILAGQPAQEETIRHLLERLGRSDLVEEWMP